MIALPLTFLPLCYFQDLFKGTGVRVEGFMGSHAPPGGLKSVQIAIATIEKANSLINRYILNADPSSF